MDELLRTRELLAQLALKSTQLRESQSRIATKLESLESIDTEARPTTEKEATSRSRTFLDKSGENDENENEAPISLLPLDIINLVALHLDLPSLHHLAWTCKTLTLALLHSPSVWRSLCTAHWRLNDPLPSYASSHGGRVLLETLFEPDAKYHQIELDTEHVDECGYSWRDVYAARCIGRTLGLRVARNLDACGAPQNITSGQHRERTVLGLRNLVIDLVHYPSRTFIQSVLEARVVKSALALLHSEQWQLSEVGAHVVAALARLDAGRRELLGSDAVRDIAAHLQAPHDSNRTKFRYLAESILLLVLPASHQIETESFQDGWEGQRHFALDSQTCHEMAMRRDRYAAMIRRVMETQEEGEDAAATSHAHLPPSRLGAGLTMLTRRGAVLTRTVYTLHRPEECSGDMMNNPPLGGSKGALVAMPRAHFAENGSALALPGALWVTPSSMEAGEEEKEEGMLVLTPCTGSSSPCYLWPVVGQSTTMSLQTGAFSSHYVGLALGPHHHPPRLPCALDIFPLAL